MRSFRRIRDINNFRIILAEDDPDDVFLTTEAIRESSPDLQVHVVSNGEELMDYLRQIQQLRAPASAYPSLILLDLNMPKKDGRQALQEIKGDIQLSQIPIVVFTTSRDQEDINFSYSQGVNSYVSKPDSYEELVKAMNVIEQYWFEIVKLPELYEHRE
jgi:CheY-like chemotaxis protein